jgi:nitrogen regulatory protein PII 1
MMIMIRAIVRPEKADAVLAALMDAGFPAVTKYSVPAAASSAASRSAR